MESSTWIEQYRQPVLHQPTAVVGSPGLRSIGDLVITHLLNDVKHELIAELFSTHFPIIYQTKPPYASHPGFPGVGGVTVKSAKTSFPSIQFYCNPTLPLIITKGRHANFDGQYEVAEKTLQFFQDFQVRKIIVVAGYGTDGNQVCCAATSKKTLRETESKFGIKSGYTGPFYGFSGLVFGLAKVHGIDAISLFSKTEPRPRNPEQPDVEASQSLYKVLAEMLTIREATFRSS